MIEVPLDVGVEPGAESSGNLGKDDGLLDAGGLDWILITGKLAILALGSGGWVFARRQRVGSKTARVDPIWRSRQRRSR